MQLWQNCTSLREHRGDGHVAALTAAGIDGCQAHHLLITEHGGCHQWSCSTTEAGTRANRPKHHSFHR
ncbi:MAG: helix-turn-helix domain-containing protein [Acidimicrobiales bacterium]